MKYKKNKLMAWLSGLYVIGIPELKSNHSLLSHFYCGTFSLFSDLPSE